MNKKSLNGILVIAGVVASVIFSLFLLFYLAPKLREKRQNKQEAKIAASIQAAINIGGLSAQLMANSVNGQPATVEERKESVKNEIDKYVYSTGSPLKGNLKLGGIYNYKVTVHNDTDYPIDKVTVKVTYIKEDGGVHKTEQMTFANIAPHKTSMKKAPDSNRGTKVTNSVVKIESVALGMQ